METLLPICHSSPNVTAVDSATKIPANNKRMAAPGSTASPSNSSPHSLDTIDAHANSIGDSGVSPKQLLTRYPSQQHLSPTTTTTEDRSDQTLPTNGCRDITANGSGYRSNLASSSSSIADKERSKRKTNKQHGVCSNRRLYTPLTLAVPGDTFATPQLHTRAETVVRNLLLQPSPLAPPQNSSLWRGPPQKAHHHRQISTLVGASQSGNNAFTYHQHHSIDQHHGTGHRDMLSASLGPLAANGGGGINRMLLNRLLLHEGLELGAAEKVVNGATAASGGGASNAAANMLLNMRSEDPAGGRLLSHEEQLASLLLLRRSAASQQATDIKNLLIPPPPPTYPTESTSLLPPHSTLSMPQHQQHPQLPPAQQDYASLLHTQMSRFYAAAAAAMATTSSPALGAATATEPQDILPMPSISLLGSSLSQHQHRLNQLLLLASVNGPQTLAASQTPTPPPASHCYLQNGSLVTTPALATTTTRTNGFAETILNPADTNGSHCAADMTYKNLSAFHPPTAKEQQRRTADSSNGPISNAGAGAARKSASARSTAATTRREGVIRKTTATSPTCTAEHTSTAGGWSVGTNGIDSVSNGFKENGNRVEENETASRHSEIYGSSSPSRIGHSAAKLSKATTSGDNSNNGYGGEALVGVERDFGEVVAAGTQTNLIPFPTFPSSSAAASETFICTSSSSYSASSSSRVLEGTNSSRSSGSGSNLPTPPTPQHLDSNGRHHLHHHHHAHQDNEDADDSIYSGGEGGDVEMEEKISIRKQLNGGGKSSATTTATDDALTDLHLANGNGIDDQHSQYHHHQPRYSEKIAAKRRRTTTPLANDVNTTNGDGSSHCYAAAAGGEADAKETNGNEVPSTNNRRRRKDLVRDEAYWERRRKNNDAAKRSRDSRRRKEDEIAMRATLLEQENISLRYEVERLRAECARFHRSIVVLNGNSSNGGGSKGGGKEDFPIGRLLANGKDRKGSTQVSTPSRESHHRHHHNRDNEGKNAGQSDGFHVNFAHGTTNGSSRVMAGLKEDPTVIETTFPPLGNSFTPDNGVSLFAPRAAQQTLAANQYYRHHQHLGLMEETLKLVMGLE